MHQLIIFMAGLINAVYLLPLYQDAKKNNSLWFLFALFGFLVLPAFTLAFYIVSYDPHFSILEYLAMAGCGLVYGVGITLLIIAIKHIGIGIPYVLSLVLGSLVGALFSSFILHTLSTISPLTWLGYGLFIGAAIIVSISLSLREKVHIHKKTLIYLLLCVVASILCATQGGCLSYFSNAIKIANAPSYEQLIPWLIIFICCSFSIMGYHSKYINKSTISTQNIFRVILMAGFYWASVILYDYSNKSAGLFSERYNWAIFIASMLIGGNFVSYCRGEWKNASIICHILNLSAIIIATVSCVIISLKGA